MNGTTTLWEIDSCYVVTAKTDVIDVKTSDTAQGRLLKLDAALEDDVNLHIEFGRRFVHDSTDLGVLHLPTSARDPFTLNMIEFKN